MTFAAAASNLGLRNLMTLRLLGVRTALILAVLVAGGALSLQLSGLDPQAPVGAASRSIRSEIAMGLAFAVVLAFGAQAWRRWAALLRANAPLLALPALAIASALWAPEPATALRRATAFAATMLSGVALAAYLPGLQALRFLVQAMAAAMALSIVYVAIAPGYGVHQITDGVQSVHAGDWRGLFVHRTVLGQLAALSLAASLYSGADPWPHVAIRMGAILAAALCLVMAHSGGAVVSAAILLATPWMARGGAQMIRANGLKAIGLLAGALVLTLMLAPVLTPSILSALGKDATLTGRTPMWSLMLRAAAERPILGYGYSTGFRDVVAKLVAARSAFGYVPNAQNGYLDVVLNLGLVGLALALGALGVAVWRSLRLTALTVLPLLVVVFIAEMNVIEAALISANDIFVLIYATILAASGDLLKSWRRSAPPPPDAPR